MATLDSLKKILKVKLNIDSKDFTEKTEFKDLDLDSLDLYEMIYDIEEEFGVSIPDSEVGDFETLGDLIKYVEEKK